MQEVLSSRRVSAMAVGAMVVIATMWANIPSAQAAPNTSELHLGEQLKVNESLVSPNGQLHLVLQEDGNLVAQGPAKESFWNTNTAGSGAVRFSFESDGNLVLFGSDDSVLFQSETANRDASILSFQDDGNLVIYNQEHTALWASGRLWFPVGLNSGETLLAGKSVDSANHASRLSLQNNGNLVLTDGQGALRWQTNTAGSGATQLVMQADGNMVLSTPEAPVWDSKTNVAGSRLVIADDGIAVVVDPTDLPLWQTSLLEAAAKLKTKQDIEAEEAAKEAAKAAAEASRRDRSSNRRTPTEKADAGGSTVNETPVGASAGASAAIAAARSKIGVPYVWGGSGPNGFDCSGLTSTAWRAAGVNLPHSSRAQYSAGNVTRVSFDAKQPGDLIFYAPGGGISHVAIYSGNGMMIEAPRAGLSVREVPVRGGALPQVGRPS